MIPVRGRQAFNLMTPEGFRLRSVFRPFSGGDDIFVQHRAALFRA